MTQADIAQGMRLKEAAGWNQTEEDWRRLLRLAPESCFGIECDGQLAATTTAICYGDALAWIGMVLTAPEFRNRGLASGLIKHTVDHLRERGICWVKLDATEMGARVYSRFGFEFECEVERWYGPARHLPELDDAHTCDTPEVSAMANRDAFAVSRLQVLEALAQSGGGCLNADGFALWRAGSEANYFGPCVAAGRTSAEQLLRCGFRSNRGGSMIWDLAPQNSAAVQLAEEYGFERRRKLWRMACALRSDAKPLRPSMDREFALAGFEYG